jgi:septal ring factor EnvC (AmiA/AmiB activator)
MKVDTLIETNLGSMDKRIAATPLSPTKLMTKREYNRRTDAERLTELESQLEKLKSKVQQEQRSDAPVLKEIKKVKTALNKFSQICADHGRTDITNSVMAFLHTLDHQAKSSPSSTQPK